ncbi:guanine nucleotide exchange factor DBS isoform X1 [Hemiscyllium ocellatum]|uniref:guanine nucleotide exchange factor DBS isoform X1 n=1 Tax=Hemiscyllium ocellatum TaxID=170820 RepID=UPI0029675C9F|nr:guanine nucleotide exchange factor DBS isoform X1 [Hemiscyllium ocellatum]
MAAVDNLKISEAEMESYYLLCSACLLLESTVRNDFVPEIANSICAKSISEDLKKKFAFLPGGRGKDDAVIITFPECPSFSEIPGEVIEKVLTYLTAIPSVHKSEIKFIIILDRRLDTWTSIKAALVQIAATCPENLQLVLVLRPTGFFQRAISDISFRFNQDDFILKLPVVMLSSVTELLRYIDETHLTHEFGGTLDYCHNEWILFRTAIESFAVMVKEIAQMLQAFGTDLAEAELPNNLHSVEDLLIARTEKYNQLKNDVQRVIKEGDLLLTNLTEPDSNAQCMMEKDGDRATVKRLLAQLHEMEMAFDGFWEKHLLKLEQCLQLWRFEQAFEEVKAALDYLASEGGDIPETGDNVAHSEQALRELSNFDEQSQELIDNAQLLLSQGDQLISNHHYAEDLIREKCKELRHCCDDLLDEMRSKYVTLNKSLELHTQLQQGLQWCDEGAYLLASQPMDKCQSQEGAKRALQEIEKFLESSGDDLLCDAEELYSEFGLILTTPIKAQIQMVHEKLESVHAMFEQRQLSLKKLAVKQARPVQPVAPRPEPSALSLKSPFNSPKHAVDSSSGSKFPFDISLYGKRNSRKPQNAKKIEVMHEISQTRNALYSLNSESDDSVEILKGHVINELIETERVYVEELSSVLQGYKMEMDNPMMISLMPSLLENKKEVLFGNMSEIYDFHSRIFLNDLQNCIEMPEKVGVCFLQRRENFQMYVKYCQNKPRSEHLWRQCSDCPFFQECQRKLDHKLGLDSYLLKPIQRLTKYQLLLKELLRFSSNGEGTQELHEALTAMLNLLKSVNDSMHQIAITGYNGNLEEFGPLLMQGSFNIWINHKKGPTKMKDLARFKPMQRHLFLHETALLFCKKREEHGEGYDKAPSYSFKHFLKMSAVGITENVKGDRRKFEVWNSGREEVYLIQAPSVDVKVAWLSEMRKVLTNQQRLLRDDSQSHHHHLTDQILLSPGKQKTASLSSEENDSELTNPVILENFSLSPQHLSTRKDWTGTLRYVEASEGNDGWSSNNDTEEEDSNQLSPGRYKARTDGKTLDSDELLIKTGDVVQLMHENGEGQWFVKNLNRGQQAWISVNSLQIIVGDCCSQTSSSSGLDIHKIRKVSSSP